MSALQEYESTPNSHLWIMNKYFTEIQGYIKEENAKEIIIYAREKFQNLLLSRKGPTIIPTVFRNHPQRYEYVREREKQLHSMRSAKNPPVLPPFQTTFSDDIYLNVMSNIRNNEFRGVIKHDLIAKLVCLNESSCAEDAFEELMSRVPHFYSSDFEEVTKSKYADPNRANWTPLPSECKNSYMFNVDFSAIYPEGLFSTVIVTCMECGRFFETVLSDITKEQTKKEILYNISHMDYNDEENRNCVVRLQTRGSKMKGCPFMEGLVAITPLTAVSVFVRTRITLYCTRSSPVGVSVHDDQSVEPNSFPKLDKIMAQYDLK